MDALIDNRQADLRRQAWRSSLARVLRAGTSDQIAMGSAGCAFYATLALFPAMGMLISIYGLIFDLAAAEQQLDLLSGFLPPPAYRLLADRIHLLVTQPNHVLSLNLAVGFLLTAWSCTTGCKSILAAINVAYDIRQQRPFLRHQALGLVMTIVAVLCAILAIGALIVLPAVIDALGLMNHGGSLVHLAGLVIMIGLFFGGALLLYRIGPHRPGHRRPWVVSGAVLATAIWVVATELLSLYASHMSSFGATYGSLGAVVAIMLWFYLSAFAVLLGAELNARLEETYQALAEASALVAADDANYLGYAGADERISASRHE
ncbi:MAG: YihY/virulence factor BrkB family protein [Proteobacteria bacterium]|nr:YihY/virulence factor BrkB family protein [Pseudomonadota bacterium]